jgi:hypothetical protein
MTKKTLLQCSIAAANALTCCIIITQAMVPPLLELCVISALVFVSEESSFVMSSFLDVRHCCRNDASHIFGECYYLGLAPS